LEKWHRQLRGELPGGLDELLADDVVFKSPIVFTLQQGKYTNGIDLITVDDDAQIVSFTVMIRPLQAALEQLNAL
jgi:hypothetical protein